MERLSHKTQKSAKNCNHKLWPTLHYKCINLNTAIAVRILTDRGENFSWLLKSISLELYSKQISGFSPQYFEQINDFSKSKWSIWSPLIKIYGTKSTSVSKPLVSFLYPINSSELSFEFKQLLILSQSISKSSAS